MTYILFPRDMIYLWNCVYWLMVAWISRLVTSLFRFILRYHTIYQSQKEVLLLLLLLDTILTILLPIRVFFQLFSSFSANLIMFDLLLHQLYSLFLMLTVSKFNANFWMCLLFGCTCSSMKHSCNNQLFCANILFT